MPKFHMDLDVHGSITIKADDQQTAVDELTKLIKLEWVEGHAQGLRVRNVTVKRVRVEED